LPQAIHPTIAQSCGGVTDIKTNSYSYRYSRLLQEDTCVYRDTYRYIHLHAKLILSASTVLPKFVDRGPVTEVTETDSNKISLNSMPVLKSFPGDAGRFITFGMTVRKYNATKGLTDLA
jgi:UbiD family decarboxylase